MTPENLWAPWRLSYVTTPKPDGCVFCAKPRETDDRESLIIARGEHGYVVLNLYPYNNGHMMAVPYRHVADLEDLTVSESAELQGLLRQAIGAARRALGPDGFNVGLNLGSAAGAGIAQHLHWHVVPRWTGDTNFMPVLADINVMPEHLEHARTKLAGAWSPATDTPDSNAGAADDGM